VSRFHRCLEQATAVDYATEDAFLGDEVLFSYCSEFAMGLALLRARYLDADVRQLAVWNGAPPERVAGTAVDVARWRRAGGGATVVSPIPGQEVRSIEGQRPDALPAVRASIDAPREGVAPRVVGAMLFADVKGFSRLTDEQLPLFAKRVLGSFASVLSHHRQDIWHRNTWGDGMYVVLS